MKIELTTEQADALAIVLDGVQRDLSHEIAGTDNAAYRARLRAERALLQQVAEALASGAAAAA